MLFYKIFGCKGIQNLYRNHSLLDIHLNHIEIIDRPFKANKNN